MTGKITRFQAATAIAFIFHAIGLVGILYFDKDFFIRATPFNLLLSFALIIWTQPGKNTGFLIFILLSSLIGFIAEIIGVNSGMLFGDYAYGDVLGLKWNRVPLLIGINWFLIIFCSGISINTLLTKIINRIGAETNANPATLKALSVLVDGASIAVFFDWLMEPVAVKLGYWSWKGDGTIPLFNYLSWFGISLLLLTAFHYLKFSKQNKFAVNLLLIQLMFFLLLRTFLK